ncbi:hypothetical protein [Sphingomonas sp.]|uniref:hypothetical protein n=1 Tax=Sphingomonas sp. TaxID=28214 RepID=UPI001EC9EA42|nr:hypothetical protein [Sphingomonas sp.]MBX3593520.1 hypothetical protein [Sphingomonas sp.]
MKLRLMMLVCGLMFLASAGPPGKVVRAGQKISWTMGEGRKLYRYGDLTAIFDRVQCAPLGDDCEEGDVNPMLTIVRTDGAKVELEGSPMQNILMLGPLTRGGPAAAFFQSYTGGMHCCEQMRVVTPGPDGLKVVDLGSYDGMDIGWPRDVDGDGTLDFVVTDDNFLYAFESYAASYAPPRVLNVVGDKAVDVTGEPRFRAVFAKPMAETRKVCASGKFPNGACAAYAAMAARTGQFDAAWPIVLSHYNKLTGVWPEGCKVARDADANCPEGKEIAYPDYPAALRAFLVENGYIPAA